MSKMPRNNTVKEDAPVNNIGDGQVAGFSPLLVARMQRRKQRMSELVRRWLQGR